jgi:tetratricopeptide (TPR) repeat protein
VPLPEQASKRITDTRPVNAEASDLYLRGRYHAFRLNRTDNDQAIQLLEKAAVLEPGFAPLQAQLAFAYANKSFMFDPSPEWDDKAFAAIQKAQAVDPDAPEIHYAMAQILWSPSHGFQSREALSEVRKTLAAQPGFDEGWHLHGLIAYHVGHLRAGLRDFEKTLSLNPANDMARFRFGPVLSYQGKYQDAMDALHRVPRSVIPGLWTYQMAWALQSLGRIEESQREVDTFLAGKVPDQGGVIHSVRAMLRAKHGDRKGAQADIDEAIHIGSSFGHFHHTAYSIGAVYSVLGDFDKAQEWIEKAAQDGFPNYSLFEVDPNLERVRAIPRFRDFVAKMRQEWEHIQGETD